MKKVEREYRKFKKEVEQRQDIVTMLESIEVLGKHLLRDELKNEHFSSLFEYDSLTGSVVDIAHTNFYHLFYKLLPELIAHDFFIALESSIDGLDNWLEDVDTADIDCKKITELKKEYYNMEYSCVVLMRLIKTKDVDVLKFLIDYGMYEVLINLFVSDEVTLKQKYDILVEVSNNKDFTLKEFLNIVPSTYMIGEWDPKIKKEAFTKILTDNLKKVSDEYRKTFNIIAINNISSDVKREHLSVDQADSLIKTFIQQNLIDINKLTFTYQDTAITAAAAAYIGGRCDLAEYLYDLPSYTEIDSKIRDDSDEVLISLGNRYRINVIDWLINRKNFTNTSDKMLYILDSIDKSSSRDWGHKYTKEDINTIIDTLIKKTKKENYREVKKALTDRKNQKLVSANEQVLLEQKRQQFTDMLRSLNDTLLESVPAKKKIKEIEFKK